MNHHHVLVALHEMEGIGWKTIQRLTDYFSDLEELIGLSQGQLAALRLAPGKAELLSRGLTRDYLSRTELAYAQSPIVPVARGDEEYPMLLDETAAPPWVIYTLGRRELLRNYAFAMVGTRTPTVYGKRTASLMAEGLSQMGACVVSGMARGIDGEAHEGALKGPGSTIAVLGCGIDVIYPREHTLLYRKIAEQGLIVSEYPPGTPAAQGLFP
ncbi:MAG: protecting protein DprA, partial [Paenibacillaceae bacterium]|nr:protecting protein DprA [Paenibacillaceae bacterium]